MSIYAVVCLSVILLYAIFMLYMLFSWLRQAEVYRSDDFDDPIFISVVIAARNEQLTIKDCLKDLVSQQYSNKHFEVVVVDDYSQDHTFEIVSGIQVEYPDLIKVYRLADLNDSGQGKKHAIREAISKSKGDLIITTDADCKFGKGWLSAMAGYYRCNSYKMLIGPVVLSEEIGIFKKMQVVEFMGLIGVTGALCFSGRPIMCNAANMAFEKSLYEKYQHLIFNNYSSGDDVFFLQAVKAGESSKAIGFIKCKEAIVYTPAKTSIGEFLMQRKRWASKASAYKDSEAKLISLLVLSSNLVVFLSTLFLFFNSDFFSLALLLFTVKTLVDFTFLYVVSGFFNLKKYFWLFIPEQLIYIAYVIFIAVFSQFGTYRWKNRDVV
jgi:cellulose synthase/poly-beta-1,6-N-acetylglucosamine synthase-like glycosyltransferase